MDEADPILSFFTSKEAESPSALYTALGAKKSDSAEELRKAYRRSALRCHPDKHASKSDAEKQTLSREFQKIGFAWAVLSDDKRKATYDATGRTAELAFADAEDVGWDAYFETLFERVDRKVLDEDKKKYQGSEEELADLREAYESTRGSFPAILDRIPHSTTLDETRLITAIEREITVGTLKRTKEWTKSSSDDKARAKRAKKANKEAKEAEEAAREMGVWDEFYGSGKKGKRNADKADGNSKKGGKKGDDASGDGGEDALAALIMRRQTERQGGLAALEDKYRQMEEDAKAKKRKKAGKANKADDEEEIAGPSADIPDDEFAALQAKMFGNSSFSSSSTAKKTKVKAETVKDEVQTEAHPGATPYIVLPGSEVSIPSSSKSVTLGPGIAASTSRATDGAVDPSSVRYISTRVGVLASTSNGKGDNTSVWVNGMSKRYIPAAKDLVLGTIIARHADGYRVDLGSAQMASLDALAFDGATKRSKPNLKVGALVYARVSMANNDMEPEIECVDPATGRAEGFGELKGGLVVPCSLELCRQLLNPKHTLLPTLATRISFETAIGLNGRVWFKTATVQETIALRRILEAIDAGELGTDKADVEAMVKRLLA